LHDWVAGQRKLVSKGSTIAKAVGYTLKRWEALTHYFVAEHVFIDNNWLKNQIFPWATGKANWLFTDSLRASQRAADIISLLQSAHLNDHDPYGYLKNVLIGLSIYWPTISHNCLCISGHPLWPERENFT
jgi:hypothetical protein